MPRQIRVEYPGAIYHVMSLARGERSEGVPGVVAPVNALAASTNTSSVSRYDANGNLTYFKDWIYTYDAQNRLRLAHHNGVLMATYFYDGKNRQIARNLNNEIRFSVWDGWELIEEYGSERAVAYLQGATGVIKSWGNNGTFYYYQDKLGSTTHIADGGGNLLESYRYDLYGTPTYYDALNNQLSTTHYSVTDLYAGERWVRELDLYDLRNRFMSSELGRFLQADPLGLQMAGRKLSAQQKAFFPAGQAPDAFASTELNLYRYCHNDPINNSDPFGLFESPLWMQATIPGQVEWDAAVTNFQAGNYGTAAALTGAMIGQQVMAVYTLGASHRANTVVQAGRTVASTTTQTTAHGAQRLAGPAATRGGVLSEAAAKTVQQTGTRLTQADGAAVHVVKTEAGRYNVVVSGDRGIITTFKNLTEKKYEKLAERYGYKN